MAARQPFRRAKTFLCSHGEKNSNLALCST